MSIYLEQIRQLVALQRVDDAIHEVKQALQSAPRECEALKQKFNTVDAQRARIMEKVEHIREQERRINAEIDEETARLRKSKNKLMQVSNTREYQAMAREMDNLEKRNHGREEERTALAEERQLQDTALVEISEAWDQAEAELKAIEESLEARTAESQAKLDALMETRSGVGSEVPRPVLERYEFIRRRLEHPVIVPVKEGICSGCRIAIPPQSFIELQSGQKILNCPNCQRLIYWCEHFEDTKATPVAAQTPVEPETDNEEE